jgi:hypothetical protein
MLVEMLKIECTLPARGEAAADAASRLLSARTNAGGCPNRDTLDAR